MRILTKNLVASAWKHNLDCQWVCQQHNDAKLIVKYTETVHQTQNQSNLMAISAQPADLSPIGNILWGAEKKNG